MFVRTHHAREPVAKQDGTTFTFVTDGIEAALEEARAAAGDKNVAIAGGANVVHQYVRAGLLDELQVTSSRYSWATAYACSSITSAPARSSSSRLA